MCGVVRKCVAVQVVFYLRNMPISRIGRDTGVLFNHLIGLGQDEIDGGAVLEGGVGSKTVRSLDLTMP